jgi:Ca-activated chloride channel family protein
VIVPRRSRGTASRRRKRRVSTRFLVVLAVIASAALMVGLSTATITSQASCNSNAVLINVAVSTDVAPPVERIAQLFNRQKHEADGRCVAVQIEPGSSAAAAALIDGQAPAGDQEPIDAWIPDSSLWIVQARRFAVGAQTVQPAGFSVARSPLMIVMPAAAAARTPAFDKASWRLLLPHSAGGPPVPDGLRVDLPDPAKSAAGLATLIEVSRLLGSGPQARVRFARFVYASAVTSYFDDPTSLASFVSLAAPPLDGYPVTVTSEQAVLAYDAANPRKPLAARYPTDASPELGSPELDYPYVLTTSDHLKLAAASLFGQALRGHYAAAVIRYADFRSADGVPDAFPASAGLDSQLLQPAPPASASEAPTALAVWDRLALGSRDLGLIDISAAMRKPASRGGPTQEQELDQTAALGLTLFPDTTQMGIWEFADRLTGALPYRRLISIGPLPANIGPISRRAALAKIVAGIQPTGGSTVALYGSILAAYHHMLATYQPNVVNSVLVLTSGVENAPGDISAAELIRKLTEPAGSTKRVAVIIIAFGGGGNFGQLQKIAAATGGQAYQITNPSQVGRVFFQAIAHRLCDPSCVAP